MKNNLVLVAALSIVITICSGIVYYRDPQNELAEEAAAQQRKERMNLQMDIEANKQDLQKTRSILLNRYPTNHSRRKRAKRECSKT
jgi:outer membrane cobalamin receptor